MNKSIFSCLIMLCFFTSFVLKGQNNNIAISKSESKGLHDVPKENKSIMQIPDEDFFDGTTRIIIEGTSISITPPKAFRFKDGSKNTFIQDWTSSNILVQEVLVPYTKMINSITKETFTKQGFELIGQYDVFTKSGHEGRMYVLSFKTGEWEYQRIVLLSGNDKKTAWITANYPEIMKHLLYEVIEKTLLNIEF